MRSDVLRALMYHRILPRSAAATVNPSLVSADVADFARQIEHVARHYRVVSAEEVLAASGSRRGLPARAVILTFDDAYRDFGEYAWPILRKRRLPATLFVSTAYPDHPEREFWWDRLHHAILNTRERSLWAAGFGVLRLDDASARLRAVRRVQDRVKQLPHADAMRLVNTLCAELGAGHATEASVLTWSELRSLANEGVTLGGHTRTHAALDRVAAGTLEDEVRGCRDDLARATGSAPPVVFAYPFGAFDAAAVDAVRDAGFRLAFTCLDGHSTLSDAEPLCLRRTNITPRTTPFLFRLRLLRLGAYLDEWRNARKHRGRGYAVPA
jgi:peptidoglycan/xylan/chitin deacetylase (PgdA/CDA1 family)